jgi:hypothetical protein
MEGQVFIFQLIVQHQQLPNATPGAVCWQTLANSTRTDHRAIADDVSNLTGGDNPSDTTRSVAL